MNIGLCLTSTAPQSWRVFRHTVHCNEISFDNQQKTNQLMSTELLLNPNDNEYSKTDLQEYFWQFE